jgi:hypothetical protein
MRQTRFECVTKGHVYRRLRPAQTLAAIDYLNVVVVGDTKTPKGALPVYRDTSAS